MDLVIAICSRGVLHSRTAESCDENLKQAGFAMKDIGLTWERVWSHAKPIPEAQNDVTDKALGLDPEAILFLEEDMVIPAQGLAIMLDLLERHEVVSARYKIRPGLWAHKLKEDGRMSYGGMGCLLVRSYIFKYLEKPYFRSDKRFEVDCLGYFRELCGETNGYGAQDIYFYYLLWKANIVAVLADVECDHLRVKKQGEPGTNVGWHEIEAIP